MNKPLDEQAREFWAAAWFFRRSGRDTSQAVKILRTISSKYPGKIGDRAGELLKGIDNGSTASTEI